MSRLVHAAAGALSLVLAASLGLLPPAPARAALITTELQGDAAHARQQLASFLARADVAQDLSRLGVAPEEAQRRVAALSDAEAIELARRAGAVPAGGDFTGVLLAVLIVFFVLVLTDLAGFTDVFPWVH